MNKTAAFLLAIGISSVLSSCFLFKKTQGPQLPQPPDKVEEGPQLPEKEKNEEEAPFDVNVFGEKNKEKVYDVALFVPLSVDDIFNDSGFTVGAHQRLPSTTLDGLSFYEGALMALDSLREQQIPIRLHVYDSRSGREPLDRLLNSGKVDSTDLIIGAVKGNAFKTIANFSKEQKINFVSATYPNDGGIANNPFLIIVNSTLRIHCVAIQSFAQQKFSNKKITAIYYNNAQGKQNLQYLQQAYQEMSYGRKVPINAFEWTNDTGIESLIGQLEQGKTNVVILTTLYPDVSLNIIAQLVPYAEEYQIKVVGMPTLRGLSELQEKKYAGITLFYSSVFPYENLADYPVMKRMMWHYFNQYHARPSNEALNGFETMFYFGSLLDRQGRYFNTDINRSSGRLMTEFNFQPIYRSDKADPPDYFENTRIYFMRERDGKVTPAS